MVTTPITVPPLTNYLLQAYGYQGALIILYGLPLQGVVCGALIISPQMALHIQRNSHKKKKEPASPGMPNEKPSEMEAKALSAKETQADPNKGTDTVDKLSVQQPPSKLFSDDHILKNEVILEAQETQCQATHAGQNMISSHDITTRCGNSQKPLPVNSPTSEVTQTSCESVDKSADSETPSMRLKGR